MRLQRHRLTWGCAVLGLAALVAGAELRENIAPQALAIPSTYPNPINDGQPIVFGRAPEFSDGKNKTGYRLLCDQPGRMEFFYDAAQPVSPGRCEVVTQMEKIRAGHVEILQAGRWVKVADLATDGWNATANWTPQPTQGVAVVIADVTDLDHEPVRVMEVRLLAEQPAGVSPEMPVLRLSTMREHHVFTLGEEVRVEATIENAQVLGEGWSWQWRWDDFINRTVDAGGRQPLVAGRSAAFTLTPVEQGPLLLKSWLVHERTGTVAAAGVLLVGVRDPEFPRSVKALQPREARPLPTRENVVGRMLWGAELYHRMLAAQFSAGVAPLAEFRRSGLNVVSAYQDLAWFEPLPGVFNFAGLDSVVQGAEENELGVELGLWRWYYGSPGLNGSGNLQYWLEPFSALKRDGTKGLRFLNAPSLYSPEYRAAALRTSEVFIRRYREHPSVLIWHVHPFGVVDHDLTSTSTEPEAPLDYSPHARQAFAAFLEQRYETIDALNQRYGSAASDFAAVPMPEPLVKSIADVRQAVMTFDNRPAWRDYLEFRDVIGVQGFQKQLYGMVRTLDAERPIGGMSNTMANSAVAEEVALRTNYGVYYGDQNTETPAFIRRYLGSAAGRLPFRGEDHSPINPWRFPGDYRARMNEFFFNCATAGVKQLNYVFPVWEENPAWEMFASPALRDAFAVNAASQALPSEMGLLHSFTTGALEGFTSYAYIELHRWLDLIAWSETMMTPGLWTEPLAIDGAADFFGKQLLIDNDSRLMTPGAVQSLVDFAEAGGDLVVQRTSGQFEPGRATPTWHLLRALGYADVAGLEKTFVAEATVRGQGMLGGVDLPLRDVSEIKQPGATLVAMVEGKVVAAVWNKGRGRVLLLGGTLGDYALAENRRRLLENQPGAWAGWGGKLQARLEVFRSLTTALQRWSKIEPQGVRSESPVFLMGRKTEQGYSIALRNPSDAALKRVTVRVPAAGASRQTALITYAGKTESVPVPVKTNDSERVVELPEVPAGAFCLIQF